MKENNEIKSKNKKDTYLLRIDSELFQQISDFVHQKKREKDKRNYSINKYIIEAIQLKNNSKE